MSKLFMSTLRVCAGGGGLTDTLCWHRDQGPGSDGEDDLSVTYGHNLTLGVTLPLQDYHFHYLSKIISNHFKSFLKLKLNNEKCQ